jgi:hypothetical protein
LRHIVSVKGCGWGYMLIHEVCVEKGDYEAALKEAFLKTDEDLRADPSFFKEPSGCTAVAGLVTQDGRIIVVSARLRGIWI